MKHMTKFVFALSLLLIASYSFAAGKYSPGRVVVNLSNPAQQYMNGDFNVRYNPAAGSQGFVQAQAGDYYVSFNGVDDSTGQSFSCSIPNTNAIFQAAIATARAAGNGSRLQVYKTSSSSTCTSVYILNNSQFLD